MTEIFATQDNIIFREDLLLGNSLNNLFAFLTVVKFYLFYTLHQLLESAKLSDIKNVNSNPQRLLTEEHFIFDLIEKIGRIITHKEGIQSYFSFLEAILHFNYLKPHSESYCRRALELLEILFCSSKLDVFLIREYLIKSIKYLMDICLLRNKLDYVKVLLKKYYFIINLIK